MLRTFGAAGDAAKAVLAAAAAIGTDEIWRSISEDPPGWEGRWTEVALNAATCARWSGKPAFGLEILEDVATICTGADEAMVWERRSVPGVDEVPLLAPPRQGQGLR